MTLLPRWAVEQLGLTPEADGIVGRSLLGHSRPLFDGPAQGWHRVAAGQ